MTEPMTPEERAQRCAGYILAGMELEEFLPTEFREAEQAARDDAFEECIAHCDSVAAVDLNSTVTATAKTLAERFRARKEGG